RALAARWRGALATFGVRPDERQAREAAWWINESLVRDRVLTALDGWLLGNPSAGVRAVLRAADPDPYRDAVRDALAAGDERAAGALARRPEALAQPARFAVILGQLNLVPGERRRAALEAALRDRPGDLGLLMGLGPSYPNRPEWAGERVRWFQAAVAAHPESATAHNNLGVALKDRGDADGALAAYRQAIRLDPTDAAPRSNLGIAL